MEADRDTDWRVDARCAAPDVNPEMWHIHNADVEFAAAEAMHVCHSHCPVRDRCLRDSEAQDPKMRQSLVQGGVLYGRTGVPARTQTVGRVCRLCGTPEYLERRDRR